MALNGPRLQLYIPKVIVMGQHPNHLFRMRYTCLVHSQSIINILDNRVITEGLSLDLLAAIPSRFPPPSCWDLIRNYVLPTIIEALVWTSGARLDDSADIMAGVYHNITDLSIIPLTNSLVDPIRIKGSWPTHKNVGHMFGSSWSSIIFVCTAFLFGDMILTDLIKGITSIPRWPWPGLDFKTWKCRSSFNI